MIIVLGATGTIGQLLVSELEKTDQEYVLISRTEKAKDIFPNQTIRYGDLDKPETLISAFEGGTSLFLLSAHGEKMEPQQIAAIDAATEVGIKRIVKISGTEVSINKNSMAETGREHWRIEQYLKEKTNDFVILRCNFFMQNLLDQVAQTVRSSRKIIMPFDKETIFSFIDANDIAACSKEVLIQPQYSGKTYYITGAPSSFLELTQVLSQHLRKKVTYKKIPMWLVRIVMRIKGGSARSVNHQLEMAEMFKQGAGAKNTDSVQEILGRSPISLNSFVEEHISHFNQNI